MRRRGPGRSDVRRAYAEKLRGWIAAHEGQARTDVAGPGFEETANGAARAALARLDTGRPVVVAGWEVRAVLPAEARPRLGGWVCLEVDGSVSPVEFVRDAADPMLIVDYRRPDGTLVHGVGGARA